MSETRTFRGVLKGHEYEGDGFSVGGTWIFTHGEGVYLWDYEGDNVEITITVKKLDDA
jgi:hypothetical protein